MSGSSRPAIVAAVATGERFGNTSPQPQRERRGFDPEAYAKSLDPAHAALAPLGVDTETYRQWKAGYASSASTVDGWPYP